MPDPETEWIDGIIPPARNWRVVHRYVGVSSGWIFDSPDACFASDGICRRIYSRFPVDSAYHYRPLTKSDLQSPDPADLSDCSGGHEHTGSIANPDEVRGAGNGSVGDGNGGSEDEALRHDNSGAGADKALLLADAAADDSCDTDAGTMRNANSCGVLSEGK